jgi:dihydrofolate reductase
VELSVFVGVSLDGFIARVDGALDWLQDDAAEGPQSDYGFQPFFDSVDALVMGRGTFDVVRTFPSWPYGAKPVVVLSSRSLSIPSALSPTVEHLSATPREIVAQLATRGWRHLYVD